MEALNPVLDGITRAYAMFAQMKNMERQDQHLRLAEQEAQRRSEADGFRQQVEDINARARLLEMGTPLGPGGMLERRATVDAGGMPGQAAPIEFSYAEKPDPSKVLTYRGRDGQPVSVVPYTRQEREKMALDQFRGQKQAELELRSQMEESELRRRGVAIPEQLAARLGVPGLAGRVVPATELDSLVRAGAYMTAMTQKPEDPVQSVQMVTNDKGDATPVVVRRSGKVETGAPMKGAGKTARPPRAAGKGKVGDGRLKDKDANEAEVKYTKVKAALEAAAQEIASIEQSLKGTFFDSNPSEKQRARLEALRSVVTTNKLLLPVYERQMNAARGSASANSGPEPKKSKEQNKPADPLGIR